MWSFAANRMVTKRRSAEMVRSPESGSGIEKPRKGFIAGLGDLAQDVVGDWFEGRSERLVKMDVEDFRSLPQDERLYLVTGLKKDQLVPGREVEISFAGNKALERAVRLKDLLNVRAVNFGNRIYKANRQGDYYNGSKYLAIGDRTKIEVAFQQVSAGKRVLEHPLGEGQPEALRAIDSLSFSGRVLVEKMPGNGGREVALFIPRGADGSKMIMHFHGTKSHDLSNATSRERLASAVKAAEEAGAVLVYALSAGYRGKKGANNAAARNNYDDRWMAADGDDPQELYSSVVARLPGVKIKELVVQGHSAGGQALRLNYTIGWGK